VCVSVCLSVSEDISGTTRAIFTKFCACCALPMAVARSSSGRVAKSLREAAVWEIFFLTDNAYGTHTKTAEPIEMPFGMISALGQRNSVLRKVTIPEGELAILGENVPDKPNTPMNFELDWSVQRRARDKGRLLIASVGRVYYRPRRGSEIAHRERILISTIALLFTVNPLFPK